MKEIIIGISILVSLYIFSYILGTIILLFKRKFSFKVSYRESFLEGVGYLAYLAPFILSLIMLYIIGKIGETIWNIF